MKHLKSKLMGALAAGMILAAGSAMAEPGESCDFEGQIGMQQLLNGERYFMCSGGQWRYFYECIYSGGECIIL